MRFLLGSRRQRTGLTKQEIATTERVIRLYLEKLAGIEADVIQGMTNAELRDALHKTIIVCELLRDYTTD